MKSFAWKPATSIRNAAETATAITAEAMTGAIEGLAAIVKAGGIDLLDLMKEGLLAPASIVNLRNVPGLDAITQDKEGSLHIGAMTTLADLSSHPLIRGSYLALADAVGASASPQIRNVATLGGQFAATAALLVFPVRCLSLLAQGGRPLLRPRGRKPVSRDLQ
jgi:xanthine dehydrogenase YagS FAD-binding subunit